MNGEEQTVGDSAPPDRGKPVPDGGEKQCVNCGAALSRYSKFCSECGAEQNAEADTGQGGSEWQQDEANSGQSTSDRWTGGDGRPGGSRQGGGGEQGRQPGGGNQSGRGRQRGPDEPQQQGGRQRGPGGPQQQGGRQRRAGRPQQRGGQQYGRQPDRLQTAGPNSSTGLAGLAHVLALFTGLFGPIILYAVTNDPFVKENAANATNWQIVLIAYNFGTFILIFVLALISEILALLTILAFFGLIGANLIFIAIGTIKALNGEAWEYPITPDLL